jgi:hypothetical protein
MPNNTTRLQLETLCQANSPTPIEVYLSIAAHCHDTTAQRLNVLIGR